MSVVVGSGETVESLPRRDDLWGRLQDGFRLGQHEHPSVGERVQWLTDHPEYLKRVTKRSTPYLYFITEQLEKRRLPLDLALLPMVESSYKPFAYSRSGASGLWQIIAATGRHLGLKQNWWYDGRRDVLDGTNAALNYLQELHAEFGNWPLALAAYNSGRGTVTRAQARSIAKRGGSDYWSIRPLLPRETQAYVPRLLALVTAVQNSEQLGLTLAPIPVTPHFSIVRFDTQVDLGLAAKLAGLDIKELQKLNPGFKRWSTDPDGPFRLLIPADDALGFQARLAKLPASERVTWRRHKIAKGETLGQIASRYGTFVDVLRKVNKLNKSLIREGRTLVIPSGATTPTALAAAVQRADKVKRPTRRRGR
ncbi:MAG: transglycosylase SLT domain-containing protein [Chromatiales bacterium]|nr:transglycosylase SLT domain-containing protein [Chromatiales bacterium]